MDRNAETSSSSFFHLRINDYRVRVDNAISTELNRRKDSVYFTPLTTALKGGKRLRPILLLLSYESVNKREIDPLPAAVAVELAHMESLIHDDIIDKDALRRETAAFHAMYGYEMALLSADFVLSMILDITARYVNPRVTRTLALATSRMCEGQLEELRVYKNKQALSMDEYINIISKKTASLFEASAKIGAIIGGASEDTVKALSDYGRLLGIAYQMQDDISDLKKSTSINILSLLDTSSERSKSFQERFKSCILEANQKLEKLRTSEANGLLMELADSVKSHSPKECMSLSGS